MRKKEVVVVTDLAHVNSDREKLKDIKKNHPSVIFSPPMQRTYDFDVLLSMNVSSENYITFVDILKKNGFEIYERPKADSPPQSSRVIVDSMKYIDKSIEDSDKRRPKNERVQKEKTLDDFIKSGDYKSIIKVSKSLYESPETVERAKNILPMVLEEVIEYLSAKGMISEYNADRSIEKLLAIGSDKLLMRENFQDEMTEAALAAIKLCETFSDNTHLLLKISNNIDVPRNACIKAAISFANIIFNDPASNKFEFELAQKQLNYRWLENIYPLVEKHLSDDEKDFYKKLINFIYESRGISERI